jgi:hypothetical protein
MIVGRSSYAGHAQLVLPIQLFVIPISPKSTCFPPYHIQLDLPLRIQLHDEHNNDKHNYYSYSDADLPH